MPDADETPKFHWMHAFRERLALDGRPNALDELAVRMEAETGKPKVSLYYEAAKQLGYKSVDHERSLWDVRHEVSSRVQEKADAENKRYVEALSSLPSDAPPAKEISWIRSHPAMSRQIRIGDKRQSVILTASDILEPPHGPAPSQSAVQQLQVWANKPEEFFKQVFGKGQLAASLSSSEASSPEATIESERETIEQTLQVLGQLSEQAKILAMQAIGLETL